MFGLIFLWKIATSATLQNWKTWYGFSVLFCALQLNYLVSCLKVTCEPFAIYYLQFYVQLGPERPLDER